MDRVLPKYIQDEMDANPNWESEWTPNRLKIIQMMGETFTRIYNQTEKSRGPNIEQGWSEKNWELLL